MLLCFYTGRFPCLTRTNKTFEITCSLWDQMLPLYSGTRCHYDLQLQKFFPSVLLCQHHPLELWALPRIPICYSVGQTAPPSSGASCHQTHLQTTITGSAFGTPGAGNIQDWHHQVILSIWGSCPALSLPELYKLLKINPTAHPLLTAQASPEQ